MKKISNNLAHVLKKIVNQKLNEYKHITLDSHYKFFDRYFIELTIIYDNNCSYISKERIDFEGNTILFNYIPKTGILKNLKFDNGYLFESFPHSIIIKDENRFLVNMKSSVMFFIEKHKTFIHKKKIDGLRWMISNHIESIKHHDSIYLRHKIYENLIGLYNYVSSNDYITEESLLVLFSEPKQHPYLSEIINNNLSSLDFEKKMTEKLNSFGGLLKTMDSSKTFYSDEIIIVFKYENLDLNSFLENIFFRFFTITKKINHKLVSFYWEKNPEGLFSLYLKADKDIIEREILPELSVKLNSNMHIKQTSDASLIYDFFQEYYSIPLSKLSEYILDLKTNEDISWTDNITISYSIEFYLSCFIKLNYSKKDFFDFNNYLSQKWQLLLLSDEELISNEYHTITDVYQKFERLYLINENALIENFAEKIDNWKIDDSFKEEIEILHENIEKEIEKPENQHISSAILTNFSDDQKYAFLEGFLFKFFGLMGLETESKVYITYIINRLSNES